MGKFVIQPHGRLQELVAHENEYSADEGLDYQISGGNIGDRMKNIDSSGKLAETRSGAYQSYEKGKGNKGEKSDISCACHWTVNNAAANKIGRMYGNAYVVTPGFSAGVPAPRGGGGSGRRTVLRGSKSGIRSAVSSGRSPPATIRAPEAGTRKARGSTVRFSKTRTVRSEKTSRNRSGRAASISAQEFPVLTPRYYT